MYDWTKANQRKCPVCGKDFIRPSENIYKIVKNYKTIDYCSYTCWRKAGGDGGNGGKRRYAGSRK